MDYIKRVTGMTIDELVFASQDCDSSDGVTTKQFLITCIFFDHQLTVV